MNAKIRQMPELKLIGLGYAGPFQTLSQGVPQIVQNLKNRLEEIPDKRDPLTRYELSIDDPNGTYTVYACTEVEGFAAIPPGMIGCTVPPRTYAHITHQGPLKEVPHTYRILFGWMSEHGYRRLSDFHSIERYHADTETDTVEIFIPVHPHPAG